MKTGIIVDVEHYIDTSYGDRAPSVLVVIRYGGKLIDTYKYNYYGERLHIGDEVEFEMSWFWDELKVLVKVR